MNEREKIHDYPKREWPENPSQSDIKEIADLFEAHCITGGKDPAIESRGLQTITNFLLSQNTETPDGVKARTYHRGIKELMEERYPADRQIELDL